MYLMDEKLCDHKDSNPQHSDPFLLYWSPSYNTDLGLLLVSMAVSSNQYPGRHCSSYHSHCFGHRQAYPDPLYPERVGGHGFAYKVEIIITLWPELFSNECSIVSVTVVRWPFVANFPWEASVKYEGLLEVCPHWTREAKYRRVFLYLRMTLGWADQLINIDKWERSGI